MNLTLTGGYLVVIPNYRRYPEVKFPQIMNDATQTVEWVETHYYDGLDHAGLIGALALPLQNSSPVISDIADFLDLHTHNRRRC